MKLPWIQESYEGLLPKYLLQLVCHPPMRKLRQMCSCGLTYEELIRMEY